MKQDDQLHRTHTWMILLNTGFEAPQLWGLKWAKKEKITVLSLWPGRLVSLCYTKMGFMLVHYGTQGQSQNLPASLQLEGSYHRNRARLSLSNRVMNSRAAKPHDLHGEEMKTCAKSRVAWFLLGRGTSMRSDCCNCHLGRLSGLLEYQALPLPIWMQEPESSWLVFDRVTFEFLQCVLTVV